MSSTLTTSPKGSPFSGKLLLLAILLGVITFALPYYYVQNQPEVRENIREMEKSSGKNGKHVNQKARESAEQEYQKVKNEFQQWDRKPNKTPDDKDYIKKLRKALEKLRQKKDFTGENHSQKHKGNWNMPTYTFITDFRGGTYICQKGAEDLSKGCLLWKEDIANGGYIPKLNTKAFIKAFNEDIDEFPPQPIDTVQNVWLFHLMLGDTQLDLHIIQTDISKQG